MKRRLLSVMLMFAMLMTLLPVGVLATDVTTDQDRSISYGFYDAAGVYYTANTDGTVQDEASQITVSKIAEPGEDANTYKITLEVIVPHTQEISFQKAATVLVMDTSGSMRGNRMQAAKAAAKNFVASYQGPPEATDRYLAIVDFANRGLIALPWTDVSTEAGRNAANAAIDAMYADGGTNLDDGLYQADQLLKQDAVKDASVKNVVAMTDGVPTFYNKNGRVAGDGGEGSRETNNATAKTAAELRKTAAVYTVCFGAKDETTWVEYGWWPWDRPEYGPTVGDFLKNSISSGDKFTYNADDADGLYNAFASIAQSIETVIQGSGWTVTDPLGENFQMVNSGDLAKGEDNTYTWTLAGGTADPDVGTIYTTTYQVRVDPGTFEPTMTAEEINATLYPMNGETYLTIPEQEKHIYFPVPSVKPLVHLVTWLEDVGGLELGKEFVCHGDQATEITTPAKQPDEKYTYTFQHWDKDITMDILEDTVFTAVWAKLNREDHIAYIIGYPEGDVRPEAQITRAEVAMIFYRLLDEDTRKANDNVNALDKYSDTDKHEWYADAVATLTNAGILNGYPDGTFCPDAPITREELAKVVALFTGETSATSTSFTDIENSWAKGYIMLAEKAGWIRGDGDGKFRPEDRITRAETITMINRAMDRVVEMEDIIDPTNGTKIRTFTDLTEKNAAGEDNWYYRAICEATYSHDYQEGKHHGEQDLVKPGRTIHHEIWVAHTAQPWETD